MSQPFAFAFRQRAVQKELVIGNKDDEATLGTRIIEVSKDQIVSEFLKVLKERKRKKSSTSNHQSSDMIVASGPNAVCGDNCVVIREKKLR